MLKIEEIEKLVSLRMGDRNIEKKFWHHLLLNTTGKKPQFLAMTFLVRKDNSKKKKKKTFKERFNFGK